MMVWRAARYRRPCDKLSIPPPVMRMRLTIRTNETSRRYSDRLLVEVESNGVESCKAPKTL